MSVRALRRIFPLRETCGVLLLLGALLLPVASRAAIDAQEAERLMRDCGLSSQLDAMESQTLAMLDEQLAGDPHRPSAADLEHARSAAHAAYAPARLKASARRVFEQETSAEHLPALRAWFDGPEGQRVARADAQAPIDPQSLVTAGREALAAGGSARHALVRQIMDATHAAQAMADLYIRSMAAVGEGMAGPAGSEPESPAALLRERLEARRPELLRNVDAFVEHAIAATYADLPDGVLAAYVAFLTSEAGRHLSSVEQHASTRAMVDAAMVFGRRMAAEPIGART